MTQAKELRKDYEAKLAELQASCPHKEIEELNYEWAPGHSAGTVKVCMECEKIIQGPYWEAR